MLPDAIVDRIDVAGIESALSETARRRIESIEHAQELESTNRHLLDGPPPATGRMRVAIAEFQTAGRGRRGRRWTMPAGSGVALSASWRFAAMPDGFSALSLAVGAAARRAIADAARIDVGLKWPNDLIVDGGKLGGILVELDRLPDGACHVVAGIGINVRLPPAVLATVCDTPGGARDLAGAAAGRPVERSAVTRALIERLAELYAGFAATGFAPYRAEWLAAHVLDGASIALSSASGTSYGTVAGIASDGALIVDDESGQTRRVISGDVTVRLADARD